MVTVDSKGRIVLPKEVRERLNITPGTEVDIREKDGKAVVESEEDPEQTIDRMEQLIAETSSDQRKTKPLDEEADPAAKKHKDAIRNRAAENSNE